MSNEETKTVGALLVPLIWLVLCALWGVAFLAVVRGCFWLAGGHLDSTLVAVFACVVAFGGGTATFGALVARLSESDR